MTPLLQHLHSHPRLQILTLLLLHYCGLLVDQALSYLDLGMLS